MEAVIELHSPEATFDLGRKLGTLVQAGDFVGLTGELGTGKTLLVRGVAKGLAVPEGQVQSPTFTIINTYAGGRLPLHHADLYRIEGLDELYATGYFDLVGGEGALLVEWVERTAGAMPKEGLQLTFERTSETSRRVSLRAAGERAGQLMAKLANG